MIDLIAEDWHNAEAHRAWGRVLLQEGKASDAVAAYRVAVSLNDRSPQLHLEFAAALLAETEKYSFIPLPNWVEAREAIENGLLLSPDHPTGLDMLKMLDANRDQALA